MHPSVGLLVALLFGKCRSKWVVLFIDDHILFYNMNGIPKQVLKPIDTFKNEQIEVGSWNWLRVIYTL